jgi:3-oxoacyl-[acyl-carrier-protein] synthase-1
MSAVVSVGARGPLGMNALSLSMGVRARKLAVLTLPWRDKRGARVGACAAGSLELAGYERMLALAAPALAEAAHGMARPLPLILALPERGRPDDDERFDGPILGALSEKSGVPISLERSRVIRQGHAGGALALALALSEPEVLVGGVDSYVHRDVIAWLDDDCRLHAGGTEEGFIPSEGAAFALLQRRAKHRLATVAGIETGMEETVLLDQPNVATTLTTMVHALVDRAAEPVDWVLSDLNGEHPRLREWMLVERRAALADPLRHDRLPQAMGDVGAATGALMLALSSHWWKAGCAPSSQVLAVLQSDGAERGAVLLRAAS